MIGGEVLRVGCQKTTVLVRLPRCLNDNETWQSSIDQGHQWKQFIDNLGYLGSKFFVLDIDIYQIICWNDYSVFLNEWIENLELLVASLMLWFETSHKKHTHFTTAIVTHE